MRVEFGQRGLISAGLAALALLTLGGCEPIGVGARDKEPSATNEQGAPSIMAGIGNDFDYRYAYRLPPSRIASVQDSHIRGCDQLGPARCRVTTERYNVGNDNQVVAVLTLQLDPGLARAFGRAAGETVTKAGGLLTSSRTAGPDTNANSARPANVVSRLRGEIADIDAQLRGNLSDEQRKAATDKQDRMRAAIGAIGELDQGATMGSATTPVLITYMSGTVLPSLGASTGASFDTAGETFLQSLSGMAQVLAGVGPWLLLLVGAALLLRRFVNPEAEPAPREIGVPLPHDEENRNVIQRWFSREPQDQHEHEHGNS